MNNQPQTWHYGIMAQHWAEFENHSLDAPDVAYYLEQIKQNGQPALDLACGTGRLLIPYLREGLDVDGCDISADMLAGCREKAAQEDLSPNLYVQAMHELDLPQTYRTIVICGSFGIGGTRQQDAQALRRIYEQLEPGGVLVFDQQMPYGGGSWYWKEWLKENRAQLDPNFWTPSEREVASDGREFRIRFRLADVNPLDQILVQQTHAELWQDGQLIAEEERTLTANIYFKHELLLMLQQAGFDEIEVCGGFTDEVATPEHDVLVFVARKH